MTHRHRMTLSEAGDVVRLLQSSHKAANRDSNFGRELHRTLQHRFGELLGGRFDNKDRGADPGDRRLDGGLGHLREPQFARYDRLHW